MYQDKIIGVMGGMGPYAGVDLVKKIFDHTIANTDQDHLPVALLSYPGWIIDRTKFLTGETTENPAEAMMEILRRMEAAGVTVAGIPCNTAHHERIFSVMQENLKREGSRIKLLNMIEEAVRFIAENEPDVSMVGVLSTTAVYRDRLYANALEEAGFTAMLPDEAVQVNVVERVIFDGDFGIKAKASPVTDTARRALLSAVSHLESKGAEVVVLGCTELPLAIPERRLNGIYFVDPTTVLARALIREVAPERMKPMEQRVPAMASNGH